MARWRDGAKSRGPVLVRAGCCGTGVPRSKRFTPRAVRKETGHREGLAAGLGNPNEPKIDKELQHLGPFASPGRVRTAMRARACPGEDPSTLPHPEAITETFVELAEAGCQRHGEVVAVRVDPGWSPPT